MCGISGDVALFFFVGKCCHVMLVVHKYSRAVVLSYFFAVSAGVLRSLQYQIYIYIYKDEFVEIEKRIFSCFDLACDLGAWFTLQNI